MKTFSVGFAEAGSGNELADARLVAEHFGTDHHELELSFAEQTVDLEELVWYLDEPLADLSALGFLALSRARGAARDGRAVGPGRRRAARRLPKAPRGGARRHAGSDCPARCAAVGARGCATRAGAVRAARRGRSRRGGPGRAAPRDERRTRRPALRQRARARTARGARRQRRAARDRRERLGDVAGRSAAGDAVPRRAARPCRRHAPLLRPGVDGALARGAGAVPRPRVRRALRDDPGAPKVRRLDTKYLLKHAARGLVPDRIIDKPKVGFFHTARRRLVPGPDARRDQRLPARAEPALRGVPRPRPRSSGSSRPCDRRTRGNDSRPALDPDARGVAVVVPSARARLAATSSARDASPSR